MARPMFWPDAVRDVVDLGDVPANGVAQPAQRVGNVRQDLGTHALLKLRSAISRIVVDRAQILHRVRQPLQPIVHVGDDAGEGRASTLFCWRR
jgi:hypothetical protein